MHRLGCEKIEMKYFSFFLLLWFIIPVQAVSQDTGKPVVSDASYFDVSPPLGSMCLEPVKKADQSWKDGAVKNFLKTSHPSGIEKPISDTITQSSSGMRLGDTLLQNFEGLSNLSTFVPPDPCGDAGPDHYFQMVNLSCAIYNKSGYRILGPFSSGSIWNGMPHNSNNGDWIVLYDENANRWFVSQFSLPDFPNAPFYQMIAVSQTPDPTGSWFRWEYTFSDLPDYPKFGIWGDGYYMSFNRIKAGIVYEGTGAAVFDRSAMLTGDPDARMILFLLNSGEDEYSQLPADCDGNFPFPGTPGYFLFVDQNYLGVREFHADWTNPANSTYGNALHVPVSPFSNYIGGIPQKGTGIALTPINDRLMFRLQFRKFGDHQSMVVNHTIDVGNRTGIRWYELRRATDNWYLYQQSTYAPDSNFRWMGSMAMDESGNMALGYSVSGPTLFPSVRYAGRMSHDPLGQLTIAEREIIPGGGAQTGEWGGRGRWGDYSAMSVDPVNPQTFWYTQEYFDSTSWNGWKTRIASFSFAGILTMQIAADPQVVCRGGSCRLTVEPSGGTGNYAYEWSSLPPGFTSTEKDPVTTPVMTTLYIGKINDGVSVCTDTIAVEILAPPDVFAGNDSTCCKHVDNIQLEGRASNILTSKWTTSGDGSFSDETSLNTLYFPGIYDKSMASVSLQLLGIPQPPCPTASSVKHVTFGPCPGIGEELPISGRMDVFPNPVKEQLFIRMNESCSSSVVIQLINPMGEVVVGESCASLKSDHIVKINVSHCPTGVYILRVETMEQVCTRQIILQR